MKKNLKKITAAVICIAVALLCAFSVFASEFSIISGKGSGTARVMSPSISTARWSSPKKSYICENSDGTLTVVDVSGSAVSASVYSQSFELISPIQVQLGFELPVFGGFYSGEKYNYIVFGDTNADEDDSKPVYKIVKYDKSFNRLGGVAVTGGECFTTVPFDAGTVAMSESGNELVIHTSRERYKSSDGLNHQSQLTIIVDTENMQVTNSLQLFQENHVSHSFNQFALHDGGARVLLDHGDAYPRSVVMHKQTASGYSEMNLFTIPGAVGANCTGVTVGGFEASENNYIAAINTIDHSKATEYGSFSITGIDKDERDIVLLISAKSNKDEANVRKVYLTDYSGKNKLGSTPYLVKMRDGIFAVLWEEYTYSGNSASFSSVKYAVVDENGSLLCDIGALTDSRLSADCNPVFSADRIIWYINSASSRNFHVLDLSAEIEKITHIHTIVAVEAKASTCITQGNNAYYRCSGCGECFKDKNAEISTTYENEKLPLAGHTGGNATCTKKAVCAVCDKEYGEMLPHTPGEWAVIKNPTITENGRQEKRCSECQTVIATADIPKLKTQTARDSATGIAVDYPESIYNGSVGVLAKSNNSAAVSSIVSGIVGNSKTAAYDIALTVNGSETAPAGDIIISIPVPADFDPAAAEVYLVNTANGTAQKINADYSAGYFRFTTNKTGCYVIAEKEVILTVSPTTINLETTDTAKLTVDAGGKEVSFKSSKTSVVTVDGEGKIKAVGAGEAEITVTVNGTDVSETVKVTVKRNIFKEIMSAIRNFFAQIAKFFSSLFN